MKKYLVAESPNKLKSGTRFVGVALETLNTQVVGIDSEDELVDLIHRITDEEAFRDAFEKRLKGTLGESLSLIVKEIERTSKENQINLWKFLEMSERFYNFDKQ